MQKVTQIRKVKVPQDTVIKIGDVRKVQIKTNTGIHEITGIFKLQTETQWRIHTLQGQEITVKKKGQILAVNVVHLDRVVRDICIDLGSLYQKLSVLLNKRELLVGLSAIQVDVNGIDAKLQSLYTRITSVEHLLEYTYKSQQTCTTQDVNVEEIRSLLQKWLQMLAWCVTGTYKEKEIQNIEVQTVDNLTVQIEGSARWLDKDDGFVKLPRGIATDTYNEISTDLKETYLKDFDDCVMYAIMKAITKTKEQYAARNLKIPVDIAYYFVLSETLQNIKATFCVEFQLCTNSAIALKRFLEVVSNNYIQTSKV